MSDSSSSTSSGGGGGETDTTGPASLTVAIVALVVAVVALVGTTAQVLQQYLATAVGYSNCGRRVMGPWARYTRLVFHPWELRFEVVFSSPEIHVLPADSAFFQNREVGGVGLGQLPDAKPITGKEIVRDQKMGITDYSASWLALLSTLREMESQHPGLSLESSALWRRHHGLAHGRLKVGVTPRSQTLDLMPEGVKKPYATTTLRDVVQLAALMGLHWKEFDRTANRYVADGNGLMMAGSAVPHLGIMFTFTCHGRQDFGVDVCVIPEFKITDLCFGLVPSILNPYFSRQGGGVGFGAKALNDLKLGSAREIAGTLAGLGCERDTAAAIASAEHLFPVLFELLFMLSRSIRTRFCPFRTLPNPLPHRWDTSTFSPAKLLDAFARRLARDDQPQSAPALSAAVPTAPPDLLRYAEALLALLAVSGGGKLAEQALTKCLHDAIEWCTEWVRPWEAVGRAEVVFVVRTHLEAVVAEVGNLRGGVGALLGAGGGVGVHGGFGGMVLFAGREDDDNDDEKVGGGAAAASGPAGWKGIAAAGPLRAAPAADEDGREARLMELYFRAVPARIVRELRQLMEKAAEGAGGGGLGTARRRREEMARAESRAVVVWLVMLLRMLCWMNLHTFHPDDVQLPKSDLVDSRLPVYIS